MPERLTDEELRLLDRRDELYALDADERIPYAAQLLLEKERDAIEQHFGDRLDSAIALWRKERERQAAPLALTNEERRLLDRRDELLGSLYGSKSHDEPHLKRNCNRKRSLRRLNSASATGWMPLSRYSGRSGNGTPRNRNGRPDCRP